MIKTGRDIRWAYAVTVLLLFVFLNAEAQESRRQYRKAKEFFDDKQYALAMESFRPLIAYDRNNPYSEYASFYYALSAYYQHFPAVAKDMLRQCAQLYPNWNQQSQVAYWLATLYFEEREYFQALRIVPAGSNSDPLVAQLKLHHLKDIQDTELLRMMLEEFPTDEIVAQVLAIRLHDEGSPFAMREAVELVERMGLHIEGMESDPSEVQQDAPVRVAVMLPFLTESLDPSPALKKNQVVLDLYQGMRLAVDSLKRAGIELELLAYDTRRDTAEIQRLLQMEEMQSVDVIVGPAFLEEVAPIRKFSKEYQTPVMNPIGYSPEFMKDNPLSLLVQPSYETIGRQSARWIHEHLGDRPTMVFYGESVRDSLMKSGFSTEAASLGLKIAHTQKVMKGGYERILTTLVKATEYDKFKNPIDFTMKRDSIHSIFVASDNELIFTKVISAVETRNDSIIIVGQETWLDKPQLDFSKFERLHIMLAAPSYADLFGTEYLRFRKAYLSRFGSMPATAQKAGYESYAKSGYVFVINLGRAFAQHGRDFFSQLSVSGVETSSSLSPGWSWQGHADNQLVPFIYFRHGQLTTGHQQ